MKTKPEKRRDELIERLVYAARSRLHHDAGDDEPQDVWEIKQLKTAFRKILKWRRADTNPGKPPIELSAEEWDLLAWALPHGVSAVATKKLLAKIGKNGQIAARLGVKAVKKGIK